ncbi:hypothetical protein Ancab_005389 [Ancistrocladus abbreviatus]
MKRNKVDEEGDKVEDEMDRIMDKATIEAAASTSFTGVGTSHQGPPSFSSKMMQQMFLLLAPRMGWFDALIALYCKKNPHDELPEVENDDMEDCHDKTTVLRGNDLSTGGAEVACKLNGNSHHQEGDDPNDSL